MDTEYKFYIWSLLIFIPFLIWIIIICPSMFGYPIDQVKPLKTYLELLDIGIFVLWFVGVLYIYIKV